MFLKVFFFFVSFFIVSCSYERDNRSWVMYGDGVKHYEGPLNLGKGYSFRFAEKWRISYKWLSGPIDIGGCFYAGNPFRGRSDFPVLQSEKNQPFVEKDGTLYALGGKENDLYLQNMNLWVYGITREGKYRGYERFCLSVIDDSFDSVALFIVLPDPEKGTDEWIEGAEKVRINGLDWWFQQHLIQNWSDNLERGRAPIEVWVLPIPDTKYWLMIRMSSTASYKYGLGAVAHPEKHRLVHSLFRQIIESVTLEPIEPVSFDHLNLKATWKYEPKASVKSP